MITTIIALFKYKSYRIQLFFLVKFAR